MRAKRTLIAAVTAITLAACNGGDDAPVETPAIPGQETAPSVSSATTGAETSVPTTSVAVTDPPPTTAPVTTVPPTTVQAPPSTAEPITPSTLIPTAALETDPAAPANNRVITPDQRPIIDAYILGLQSIWLASTDWPLNPDHPLLLAAPISASSLERARSGWLERAARSQVLDVSGGITMRPFVVDDGDEDPNTALVWDCQIDAMYWKDVDTGEKAPPDAWPNEGPPGIEDSFATVMVNVDGRWLVDGGVAEDRACD